MCRTMCDTGVYATSVLHVLNMCIIHVSASHVIHLYFYTCNTTLVLTVVAPLTTVCIYK